MTYTLTKEITTSTSEHEVVNVAMVEVDKPHTVVDFENGKYVQVDTFKFESGWIQVDENTKVEVTRLLQSCDKEHDHGVYYQAPRQMELWEAMFAIGEVNPGFIPDDTKYKEDK